MNRTSNSLLVGRTPAAHPPSDLMEISYVFSGADRVLGIYGRLQRLETSELMVSRFFACCSRIQAKGDIERRWFEGALRAGGWSRTETSQGDEWRLGDFHARVLEDGAEDERSFHFLVGMHGWFDQFDDYKSGAFRRHRRITSQGVVPRTKGAARIEPHSPGEALSRLEGRELILYTGAGISVAAGVPAFAGRNSLDAVLHLHEAFPGDAAALLCADPMQFARLLGTFQATLLNGEPTREHHSIAMLERMGRVRQIVSANLDLLHERAGSKSVVAPPSFANSIARYDPGDVALVVLGVSDDSYGAIAATRSHGIPVVVVDVEPPDYLTAGDCFVQATADVILDGIIESTFPGPLPIHRPSVHCRTEFTTGLPALLDTLLRSSPGAKSSIHGSRHWLETAALALMLLPDCPSADAATVLLFAMLHDSQRINDSDDPDHGRRAAGLVSQIDGRYVSLSDWQRSRLEQACALHADGFVTTDATVGLCWDADRLGLWRVGATPTPDRLSLDVSRTPECLVASRGIFMQTLEWRAIFDAFSASRSSLRRATST